MSEHQFLLVQQAIKSPEGQPMHVILAEVCAQYGVSANEMFSLRRERRIVIARWEAMLRIRNETSASYPQIGRFFHRDHTSVMHAMKRFALLKERMSTLSTDCLRTKEATPSSSNQTEERDGN